MSSPAQNDLQTFLASSHWKGNERQAMDTLQNHGLISDNCITPNDVPNGPDSDRAILFLSISDPPTTKVI